MLRTLAASGVAAGLGTVASAQEDTGEPEQIMLSGPSHGWIGMAPEEIEQQLNPTLELEAGRTYEVTWTNADGVAHNFVILSADGEQLLRSEIIEAAGVEQTVEFEATEEMSEYFCEVHPDSMRGDIAVDGEPAESREEPDVDDVPVAGNFPEGETIGLEKMAEDFPALTAFEYAEDQQGYRHFLVTQTGQIYSHRPDEMSGDDTDEADAESDTPDNVELVFDGDTRAWIGREPADIEGEENPTLELEAGKTYTFTWENADGALHNIVFRDEDGDHLEETELMDEEGETQSLEFEATEEMAEYYCEIHPSTMVGDVEIVDEDPYEDDVAEDEPDEPDDAPETDAEPEEPGAGEEPEEPTEADVLTPDDLELFLDLGPRMVDLGSEELGGYDERGLLGLAFHPDFQENGRFYVRYSAPRRDGTPDDYDHTDVLAEYQTREDGVADIESRRTLLEVPQPQDNHNGGSIAFGPEGYLYTAYGDGGNVHDIGLGHVEDWYDANEGGNGQDTSENLLGSIIRIDVDADDAENGAYGIPDDNPLVDQEGHLDEHFAWGLRNPWGMTIQDDGTIFVTDSGQHLIESAYIVERGGNYSWNVKEGSFCFSPDEPIGEVEDCPDATAEDVRGGEPLRDPVAEYRHKRATEAFIDSSVVVGGYRYDGDAIPELQGNYVFANWSSEGVVAADGELLTITPPDGDGETAADDHDHDDHADEADPAEEEDAGNGQAADVDPHPDRWDLAELQIENAPRESLNRYAYNVMRDQDGELYVLTNTDYRPFPQTGEIYKVVPAEDGEPVPEPDEARTVEEAGEPEAEAPREADESPGADEEPPEDAETPDDAPPEDAEGPPEEPGDEDGTDQTSPDDDPDDDGY